MQWGNISATYTWDLQELANIRVTVSDDGKEFIMEI